MQNNLRFRLSIILLGLLLCISSCTKTTVKENAPISSFVFKYTLACGWCAGSQILTITDHKVEYEFPAICDISTRYSSKELDSTELIQLQLEKLKNLVSEISMDECGVCYDGCDETLQFIQDSDEHYIRFTSTDSIQEIGILMGNIRSLMTDMNELSKQ